MAKIVNKEEKRKQIALACKDLLLQNGIKKITVSALANKAGIGKGTIYEYFSNKEDIVFEILNILSEEYYEQMLLQMQNKTPLEKLNIFFEFFVTKKDDLIKIYKEFLAINLSEEQKFIEFHSFLKETYLKLLKEIVKDEKLSEILLSYATGYFLQKETTLNSKEFYGIEIYKTLKGKL